LKHSSSNHNFTAMLYACPPKMSIVSGRYVLCDFEKGVIFLQTIYQL